MTRGRQRWDGLYTLGLCVVVLAGILGFDAALEQRELASIPPSDGAGARQEQPKAPSAVAIPDVVITGFQFLHALPKPEATPLWELKADSASMFEQRQEATLQMIHAVFQPDAVRGTSGGELDGEEGRFDLSRSNFDVVGATQPVTVRFARQYTLTTSQLQWNNAAESLTTDQPVEIIGEGLVVTGTGFEWLQSSGAMSVRRDIHTMVKR